MQKMQQIWTFTLFKVVRQHTLGVVGNITYCFVGNLSLSSTIGWNVF